MAAEVVVNSKAIEEQARDIERAKRALIGRLAERGYQLLREEVPYQTGNLKQGVAPPDVDYQKLEALLTVSARSAARGGEQGTVLRCRREGKEKGHAAAAAGIQLCRCSCTRTSGDQPEEWKGPADPRAHCSRGRRLSARRRADLHISKIGSGDAAESFRRESSKTPRERIGLDRGKGPGTVCVRNMNAAHIDTSGDIRNVRLEQLAFDLTSLKKTNRQFAIEISGELKDKWRKQYFSNEFRLTGIDIDAVRRRSSEFWQRYELVNRILDPDDPVYSIINAGTALSTTGDNLAFQAAAAGQGRILELIIGGEATASAVNRVSVQRAGTTITANSAITPEKFNSRSPAAAGTYGKAGTQALVGNPMLSLGFNAFGGFIRWVAAPGEEIYYVNSEIISMRSASGTSAVSSTGIFEEL
jgi:hypothetical protein